MATQPAIPNEFTACEQYRGHVVAIRDGLYSIFGGGLPGRVSGGLSRADARRKIDCWWSDAGQGDADARAHERRQLGSQSN